MLLKVRFFFRNLYSLCTLLFAIVCVYYLCIMCTFITSHTKYNFNVVVRYRTDTSKKEVIRSGPSWLEFACFPCVCMSLLQALQFSPSPKTCKLIGNIENAHFFVLINKHIEHSKMVMGSIPRTVQILSVWSSPQTVRLIEDTEMTHMYVWTGALPGCFCTH